MTITVTIKADGIADANRKVRINTRDSESEKTIYLTKNGEETTVKLVGDTKLVVREVGGGAERTIVKA